MSFGYFPAPPVITGPNSPTPVVVTSGGNLILLCNASGYPAPNISWFRGQSKVDDSSVTVAATMSQEGNELVVVSSVFSITGVQLQDEENYTCRATNIFGNASQVVSQVTIEGEWWDDLGLVQDTCLYIAEPAAVILSALACTCKACTCTCTVDMYMYCSDVDMYMYCR